MRNFVRNTVITTGLIGAFLFAARDENHEHVDPTQDHNHSPCAYLAEADEQNIETKPESILTGFINRASDGFEYLKCHTNHNVWPHDHDEAPAQTLEQ